VLGIELPQRFRVVNDDSPLTAGIHLLAFSVAIPIGSLTGNIVSTAVKTPVIYFTLAFSAIGLLGVILLSQISGSEKLSPAIFGYEILAGFGSGAVFSVLALAVPVCVEQRDIGLFPASMIHSHILIR
jgi:hypothetical protein